MSTPHLSDLLDEWSVLGPGLWENTTGPAGWYAVCDDRRGILAYFLEEKDALRFRMSEINRQLNG